MDDTDRSFLDDLIPWSKKFAGEYSKTKEDQLSQAAKAAFDWFSTCYGAFNFRYHFDIKQGCRISKYC